MASNQVFHLYDNKRYSEQIVPIFIISNFDHTVGSIKKIRCELEGVSQWYCQQSSFNFTSDTPSKLEREEIPSVEYQFEIDDKKYFFELHHQATLSHSILADSNVQLKDIAAIYLTPVSNEVDPRSIVDLLHDIRMLFSLLLGYCVNLQHVEVFNDKKQKMAFYYPTPDDNFPQIRWYGEYLTTPSFFIQFAKEILTNFFTAKRNIFLTCWYRYIALSSQSHFIEYELLTYLTILDGYVSYRAKELEQKCSDKKYDELLSDLSSVLESYKKSSPEDSLAFQAWIDKIDTAMLGEKFPATSLVTLKDKFKAVLGTYPKEATTVFLKNSEIQRIIVDDRNDIAHGREAKSSLDKLNHRLHTVKSVLAFFAFSDLGISPRDFLKQYSVSHHPIKHHKAFNQVALDRYLGTVPFFHVSNSDYDYLSQNKERTVVLHKKKDKYEFLPEETKATQAWPKNNDGIRQVADYVQQKVITKPGLKASYVGTPYIVSKRRQPHQLFQVIVIE
nr:hypothetical protein [Halodesulfovibrio sp.]